MAVHRIHLPELRAHVEVGGGTALTITGPEAEHALRVKRLRPGEAVEVFDGAGAWLPGALAEPRADARATPATAAGRRPRARDLELIVNLTGQLRVEPAARPPIVMAAPAAKGSRPDEMIDLLSQVGVDAWLPLRTERTVIDPRERRPDKWQRRAIEAAKQCGRRHLLDIREPIHLADLIDAANEHRRAAAGPRDDHASNPAPPRLFVADAGAESGPETADIDDRSPDAEVIMVIGPEGGLTPTELDDLRRIARASPVRLGPHIMRIETTAVAAGVLLVAARSRGSARSEKAVPPERGERP